jgi:hypothetical protein
MYSDPDTGQLGGRRNLMGNETLISLFSGGAIGALITWVAGWLRERRSVNVALEAEIERTCEAIKKQLEFIRGLGGTIIQPQAIGVPWLPFRTPVWDGLVDKIGVLGYRRAGEIARFFGYLQFVNEFLNMRGEYEKLQRTQEFVERYIKLLEVQLDLRPAP